MMTPLMMMGAVMAIKTIMVAERMTMEVVLMMKVGGSDDESDDRAVGGEEDEGGGSHLVSAL